MAKVMKDLTSKFLSDLLNFFDGNTNPQNLIINDNSKMIHTISKVINPYSNNY